MTKEELLALDEAAGLTLSQLATLNGQLLASLQSRLGNQRKNAVLGAFSGVSSALVDHLRQIDFTPNQEPISLREVILASLDQQVASDVTQEAVQRLIDLERSSLLTDPAAFGGPISEHPVFQEDLQRASLYKLADAARVADPEADKLVAALPNIAAVTDGALKGLVSSQVLSEEDARRFGLATSLYNLADCRPALAAELQGAEWASLGNRRVESAEDLAALRVEDWTAAIERSQVDSPEGLEATTYAAQLSRAAQAIFPTQALLARITPADPQGHAAALAFALEQVRPLLAADSAALRRPFEELDTSNVDHEALPELREAHDQLQRLVNLHPGLRLDDILAGPTSDAEQVETVRERTGLIARVAELNPGASLLALDYSAGNADLAALRLDGIPNEQHNMVVAELKAHQRVYSLTEDVDDAVTVLQSGFSSSVGIATVSFEAFQQNTGFEPALAQRYYGAAQSTVAQVSTMVGSIVDTVNDDRYFHGLKLSPPIADYLKKLDGFADLFGSQASCNCRHCQSILSPAAYFVDLMRFVEKQVSDRHFSGAKSTHPLYLRSRRPDLWTLPLTCENTDTLVPYLDIINEILENAIATERGFTGSLEDRRAVEDVVYRQLLASDAATDSLQQPFSLPLERLDSYLGYFDRPRLAIADVLSSDPVVVAVAALKLSRREYELITKPNTTAAFLSSLFGVPFRFGSDGVVEPFDAELLLKYTGLRRDELGLLLATRFVSPGPPGVQLISEKRTHESVQNDIEKVHNLTAEALDRLHRFIRLWRKVGWTIPELDLLLAQLGKAGVAATIDASALTALVGVLRLRDRWQLPAEEICGLWGDVPQVALSPDTSLFDRLFNFRPFVLTDGSLVKDPPVIFVHPSFRKAGVPAPVDNTLHRLLAGLQVTSDQLATLIAKLAPALGVKLETASETDRGFVVTVANVSLLYRHARLAQLLDASIDDLFVLIDFAGIGGHRVASLSDLEALLSFTDWWQTSGFSLDDLRLITHGTVQSPASYPDKATLATQIVASVQADKCLQFADTVFAFLPGVTEDQSRAIIAKNAGMFEPSTDATGMRLVATFDPSGALTIPAGITLSADAAHALEDAARAALLKYHAGEVLAMRLAARLNVPLKRMSALLTMLGTNLAAPALVHAVRGSGSPSPLVDLLDRAIPLTVLFCNSVFDAPAIRFVSEHAAVFGVDSFAAIGINAIRKVSIYAALGTSSLPASTTDVVLVDALSVQAAFGGFDPVQKFAKVDPKKLAAALQTDATLLSTVLPAVTLPATAPEALVALGKALALAIHLGVDGNAIKLILSDDYDDLARAGRAVLGAIRAKLPGEQDFLDALAPLDDSVRSRRRDALTDALIRTVLPDVFETREQLYDHFLVDVQLEGCARTSRLVAAISSVQLYVYRVLMNLEQDRRTGSDPMHIHVRPADIPADEWTWRKNYRVWEANRKVFLYPESYIEPELRDDRTPLFRDLEDTLLQQQITEQNVLDAYGTYLSAFDEISKLRIAGSYHDNHPGSPTSPPSDVLHLFGVAPGDPPIYYYRTIENAYNGEVSKGSGVLFHPWRRLDVQIPTDKVSPVVYLGRLYVFWTQIVTTPKSVISGGTSDFVGYKHRMTLQFTMLRLDGTWTPPQSISLSDPSLFGSGDGIVDDPLAEQAESDAVKATGPQPPWGQVADPIAYANAKVRATTPRFDTRVHLEPLDGYTLSGFQWDRVYPHVGWDGSLTITYRNFVMRSGVDFYKRIIVRRPDSMASGVGVLGARDDPDGRRRLYYGPRVNRFLDDYPECAILSDQRHLDRLRKDKESTALLNSWQTGLFETAIATLHDPAAEIDIVNVNTYCSDAIVDSSGDLLLLQGLVRPGSLYLLKRLGTTLGETLSRTLFTGGVNALLDAETQSKLGEDPLPLDLIRDIENAGNAGRLDFTGSFGTYYREILFQIPYLIANLLNSQQQFAAAQRWYSYIFDPTADDKAPLPPGLPAAESHRVWRYREFRDLNGLDLPTMRKILTEPAPIEAYKKDPFNPHAIARLRLSAYQKCIVMKYISNLLDWGDSLFTQFTTESVGEATTLYVLASEILGPRPAQLGDCGEANVTPRDYATIAPLMEEKRGSEFLAELESWIVIDTPATKKAKSVQIAHVVDHATVGFFRESVAGRLAYTADALMSLPADLAPQLRRVATDTVALPREAAAMRTTATPVEAESARVRAEASIPSYQRGVARPYDWNQTHVSSWSAGERGLQHTIDNNSTGLSDSRRVSGFGWGLVQQFSPVFCVPPNADLLTYWDRVEDRLGKIRHCRDITGATRQLALFSPEIDPRLLVRAKAAGISLEDVLNGTSGNLPPYRFSYLIEKAKQYAAVVQSFGAQLLGAVEKRDAEELSLLRTVQQQNLLKMSTKVRQEEIKIALDSIQALEQQQKTVEFRRDYYENLIREGRSAWEIAQEVAQHGTPILQTEAIILDIVAAVAKLSPQIGSPVAMKYGGLEVGGSANAWAALFRDVASVAQAVSASAGLQAGFLRRADGWQHQVDLAKHELEQIKPQMTIAEIRRDIAVRSLEIHTKTMEQAEEIYDLFRSRFSNLALYTWLSTSLQRSYRDAYNAAYSMAKLAEQAFRFERSDDATPVLASDYWDAAKAGLLAGDRLMGGLQALERRFIETNYRTLEIDQAFSLTQIAPAALVKLREEGECTFDIPELFFDLAYPGHYRRRIKAVRLTIPCVTGPYTNVGATLSLTSSRIRAIPQLHSDPTPVPVRRSVSIATSTAQNDAGVFEFSFHDERYMPFEGAGAISSWQLTLPRSFRQFDYETINDVILHVGYTADADDVLRTNVESLMRGTEATILTVLRDNKTPIGRIFSLRQDLSGSLNRLLHSPANTPVTIQLTDGHLPIFLRGRKIKVSKATLALRTPPKQTVDKLTIALDGKDQTLFMRDKKLGNLWAVDVTANLVGGLLGEHTLVVKGGGDLSPIPQPGDDSVIDSDKLRDILLYVEYNLE